MNINNINTFNKRGLLLGKLIDYIRERSFLHGKLPSERELARMFGVSRNLIREAIVVLETMGVVKVIERQGIFIKKPETDQIKNSLVGATFWPENITQHLMEMRLIIEVPACGLAAKRRTEEDIKKIKKCIFRLEEVHKEGIVGAEWDSMFHTVIVEAAHNPFLSKSYEGLSVLMTKYMVSMRSKLLSLEMWADKLLSQHKAIASAIIEKDSKKAEQIMRMHLEGAMHKLIELEREEKAKNYKKLGLRTQEL